MRAAVNSSKNQSSNSSIAGPNSAEWKREEREREKRTGSVLAAADLNELLDVENLGRHDGRCVVWLN